MLYTNIKGDIRGDILRPDLRWATTLSFPLTHSRLPPSCLRHPLPPPPPRRLPLPLLPPLLLPLRGVARRPLRGLGQSTGCL